MKEPILLVLFEKQSLVFSSEDQEGAKPDSY